MKENDVKYLISLSNPMLEGYEEFKKLSDKKCIKMIDKRFNKCIQEFSFLQIQNDCKFDCQILEKVNKCNHAISDTIFSSSNKGNIFYVQGQPDRNREDYDNFKEELNNFMDNCEINSNNSIKQFWNLIKPCISAYLITKSRSNSLIKINYFIENFEKTKDIKNYEYNEFIPLRIIGISSSSSKTELCYHIKNEKIVAIKTYVNEITKLEQREINNYKFLNYPLIPTFYGQINRRNSIVIDFIEGQQLNNENKNNLRLEERIIITFQI